MIAPQTHAAFLQDIEAWIQQRFPTRQLSADDIFYAIEWANSGIPATYLLHGFESWIETHPKSFDKSPRLAALRFEAKRIIDAFQANTTTPKFQPYDDPYDEAFLRITAVGKQTQNDLLRDALRQFYLQLLHDRSQSRPLCPQWQNDPQALLSLKAHRILAWDQALNLLFKACLNMLSDDEKQSLQTLSPRESAHCLRIGDEAKTIYKTQLLNQKLAEYFGFSKLLEPF